jgi:L-malate glycosyltransferase
LVENPKLAEELAQRGFDRSISQYTNKALAKQLLAFYKKILAE